MKEVIIKLLDSIKQNQSPEEIERLLRLPPGCKFTHWEEERWNQSKGCFEKRRCGKIYNCDDPINNNIYCTEWECE